MASGTWQLFGSAALALANGTLNLGSGTFHIMLAGTAYTPNVDADDARADVTPETTGTNWPSGGVPVTLSFAKSDASNRVAIIATDVSVPTVTLTDGKHAVLYKALGGASSADPLIAYCTFDVPLSPTAGTLALDNDGVNGCVYLAY